MLYNMLFHLWIEFLLLVFKFLFCPFGSFSHALEFLKIFLHSTHILKPLFYLFKHIKLTYYFVMITVSLWVWFCWLLHLLVLSHGALFPCVFYVFETLGILSSLDWDWFLMISASHIWVITDVWFSFFFFNIFIGV